MTFTLASLVITSATALLCVGAGAAETEPKPSDARGDYVILLHGLGRTSASMKRIEWHLANRGYRVINQTYPSTRASVENLADNYLDRLLHQKILDPTVKVHFVTHSLGGILLRQYLSSHQVKNLGRVVMLAPPNRGSEIIDRLSANPITHALFGPRRLVLGTSECDLPNRLGPVSFECGIIAGDRSFNPFLSHCLPGPNDGKVTVASAQVEGMRDFLVLHSSHTWLMWRTPVLRQIVHFIEAGSFEHAASSPNTGS